MTGTSTAATFSTSPYVAQAAGTAYGAGYAVAATGTVTEAAGTTLVTSPIATACFACHDSTKVVAGKTESAVDHMKRQGASLYTARTTGLATKEICMDCHSATNDRGLGIKEVHKIK